ncbi:ROK family protein [Saccharopolyspora erythraea]|uniref:ROK family protein n=1 Tax=Saccharopolyspora erythraea TaxID=1836 RepID=UPI0024AF18EE|nr:ROK family protein [Saccharopolyspora erythraea]
MDIGGTKVAMRAEGEDAEPHETSFRWPVPAEVRADLAALESHVATLRHRWPEPFDAVGVAVPATLDAAGRVLTWPGRPVWEGADLVSRLRALFPGSAVRCADDGDLAALAEADRAGCRDVVYIGVGTGIGGGVVVNGESVPGPARGSCEIGHLVVDPSGDKCDCGRLGCVQAAASGPAVLRRAGELRGCPVTFDELRAAWADGQPWARSALDTGAAALATAVTGLCELVHPDLVLIGGGFAAALPDFVPAVAERTRLLARPGSPAPPVEAAALGGLSSLHGALLLARREESA